MIQGSKTLKITPHLRKRLRDALKEDLGRGDISSFVSFPANMKGRAVILVKQGGIVAGLPVAAEIFRLLDPQLKMIQKMKDGRRVRKGDVAAVVQGNLRAILAGERLALNFIQRLSGIATLTHEFVRRVRGTRAKILDTRKTTPLWRDLEKYAVRIGGGFNHRFSLDEAIMIKDTHWTAMSRQKLAGLRRRSVPLIIEVHSRKQLEEALQADPYVIMFDNHGLNALRQGIRYARNWSQKHKKSCPQIEASGGVTMQNIRRIAKAGVDRISVGAVTHSAPALDFSLKVV